MRTAPQLRGERGQVLSSAVAVAAVVAVVIGLLVLFGTGGPSGGSDDTGSGGTSPSTSTASSPAPSTPQVTPSTASATPQTTPQTTPPSQQPTSAPTRPSETTEPPEATERPTATGPRPSVEIYNNTTQRGLADRVSRRARDAGWRVAGIDNWRGKVAASTVYYPAGLRDHATALASDLGVGRVKEALSNMKKDRLTVILTSDYSG